MALEELLNDIKRIGDTKSTLDQFMVHIKATTDVFNKLKGNVDALIKDLKAQATETVSTLNEQFNQLSQSMDARISTMEARIASIRDGMDGLPGSPGLDAPQIEQIVPAVIDALGKQENRAPILPGPEEIATMLDLLPEGSEPAILKAILDRLDKVEKRPNVGGWSSAGGGKIAKYYDLSDQLNGSTTTFSLPAFWRVLSVQLSGAPVLRQTTDYTVDGTLFKITFTSQIDAATQLAAGQSCIVIYAEA